MLCVNGMLSGIGVGGLGVINLPSSSKSFYVVKVMLVRCNVVKVIDNVMH